MNRIMTKHCTAAAIVAVLAALLASSMMFAPVAIADDGVEENKTEKLAIPTIDKQVMEDSTGEWGDIADAEVSSTVRFRIVGTVGEGIGNFDRYPYRFEDVPAEGLVPDVSTCRAMVDGKDVAASDVSFTMGDDGVLVIDFPDLVKLGATKDSEVVVTYDGMIEPSATLRCGMSGGYMNKARVLFSRWPTQPDYLVPSEYDDAVVLTYRVSFLKVSAGDVKPLPGAVFALRDAETELILTKGGKWVSEWNATECSFTSGEDGSLVFEGLDSGTYQVVEVTAPSGFETPERGVLVALTANFSNGDLKGEVSHELAKPVSVDAGLGEFAVQMSNKPGTPEKKDDPYRETKHYGMPETGDSLPGYILMAAAVFFAASVATFIASAVRRGSAGRRDWTVTGMDMLGTVLVGMVAGIIVGVAVLGLDSALRRAEHDLDMRYRSKDDDD